MNYLHEVLENYLSSTWGNQQYKEALQIIQEAINGSCIYTFSKFRQTIQVDGKKTFKEGWKRDDGPPTFYSCLGSFSKPKDINFEMPTLTSVEGEPKVKHTLTVLNWSTWYALNQLFGDDAFVFSNGRLIIRSKSKVQAVIDQWQAEFSYINTTHMHYVLTTFYSAFDLVRIENSTPKKVEEWIYELETFGNSKNHWVTSDDTVPLFSLGLTGYSKALKERKNARVNFWRTWNINRFSLKESDQFLLTEEDKKYA